MSYFRAGFLIWFFRLLTVVCANYVSATALEMMLLLAFPFAIDAVLCSRIGHMRRASDLSVSWRAQTLEQKVLPSAPREAAATDQSVQTEPELASGMTARFKEG